MTPIEIVRQRQRELANDAADQAARDQAEKDARCDRRIALMRPLLDFLLPLLEFESKASTASGIDNSPPDYRTYFGFVNASQIEICRPTMWSLQPNEEGTMLLITCGFSTNHISTVEAEAMLIEHAANFCELPPPPATKRTMTFEEWQATGRGVSRLGDTVEAADEHCRNEPGRVYHGGLWIVGPWVNGHWYVLIERDEYTGTLDNLERKLYEWALGAVDMEVPA